MNKDTHDKEWTDLELAKLFHSCYEKNAVNFNWETNPDCKKKHWSELPENNKKTMIATCADIRNIVFDQLRREQQEADKLWWASMVDKVKLEAIRNYKNSSEFISERNELKKELLDEFKSFLDNYHNLENKFYAFRYIAENKVAYYRYDGLLKQFELFRAKTLREQVKKE